MVRRWSQFCCWLERLKHICSVVLATATVIVLFLPYALPVYNVQSMPSYAGSASRMSLGSESYYATTIVAATLVNMYGATMMFDAVFGANRRGGRVILLYITLAIFQAIMLAIVIPLKDTVMFWSLFNMRDFVLFYSLLSYLQSFGGEVWNRNGRSVLLLVVVAARIITRCVQYVDGR